MNDTSLEKAAYVQVLQHHDDICENVIIFAELARQKSLAQRILLYPQQWREEMATGRSSDRVKERSIRLLRRATARHGISLRGVDIATSGKEAKDKPHSIASMLSLTEFETIIYLQPSGFVSNAVVLDNLFRLPKDSTMMHFRSPLRGQSSPMAFMMSPSPEAYELASKETSSEMSFKQSAAALQSIPVSEKAFLASSDLSSEEYSLGSENPLSRVGYVRFTDDNIYGPEFDIPWRTWSRAQPSDTTQRIIWESLYEQFRGQRMGVCGLDLEPLPAKAREDELKLEV